MKVCPQCGFRHVDLDERCVRCGAYLDAIGRGAPADDLPRERFKFDPAEVPRWRPRWPGLLAATLRRRLHFTRRALESDLPEGVHHRNPWLSAALSLLPGLGQLYNHQPKKALLIFLFVGASLGLACATLYNPWSNFFLLGYFFAMLYSFHDGFVTAKKINREPFIWQHGVAFYCAWIFYVGIFCIAFQYVTAHCFMQFRYISYNELSPYLRRGERVVLLVDHHPKVGDIVLYGPRELVFEVIKDLENDTIIFHPTSMIERVVAEPGQTFERRAGVFYRDGRPVPPSESPLVTEYLWSDFKLTAPPGGYIILMSYTFGVDPFYSILAPCGPDHPPKLNAPGQIVHDWDKCCVVYPDRISGKLWFVYQPPPARRILR